MSTEAAQILILKREKESGYYCYHSEADQDHNRRTITFWDEVAQKWPKQRFSSFFPVYQNA